MKTARKKPSKPATAARPGPRADFGAPIDGFFAKQTGALHPLLATLRELVEKAAPDAQSALKWGMPSYSIGGKLICMLAGHKAHVNLVLSGPAGTFVDPKGLLSGSDGRGCHLKLTSLDELPRAEVKRWVAAAAAHARKK